MEFKDRLKELRIGKGISQRELADLIFISRSAVAKWENGLAMPKEESIERLCEIFNVEREVLFKDRDDQELQIKKNKTILKYKKIVIIMGAVITSYLLFLSIYYLIKLINKPTYIQPEEMMEAPEGKLNDNFCTYSINNVDANYYYQKANYRLPEIYKSKKGFNYQKNIFDVSIQDKTNKYVFTLSNAELKLEDIYVDYYYLNSNNEFFPIDETNITKSFFEDNTPNYREVDTKKNEFVIPENGYRNLIEIKAKIGKYYFIYYFIIE